jgi:elongation factor P
MVLASQLRPGMAIRYEGQSYKVISSEYHPGQGKMGGVAHVRLKNLSTGTFRDHSFRAELKLDVLPVEKQSLAFLYSDADQCFFMNPETFDQIGIDSALIGAASRFLQPEMQLPVEFVEGRPVSVVFPDIIEMRVAETAPPAHGQQDNTWKTARLDNGVEIMVPQFIKVGDMIRLEVEELRYVDRAKAAAR